MQPFDGVSVPIPQPQTQPAYPSAAQIGQGQGQYPSGPQQSSYPTSAQRNSYPQNYQAPYPGQNYQQQPGGYPNYPAQSQPQYGQGANQGQAPAQKQGMAPRPTKNTQEDSKKYVTYYSVFVTFVSIVFMFSFVSGDNYQIVMNVYQKIAGHSFIASDVFSSNTCQALLAGTIAVPVYLLVFAIFNLVAMLVSLTGLHHCMFIQPVATVLWAGTAAIASQQNCSGNSTAASMFGANTLPESSWSYYAFLAIASSVASVLNYSWNNKKIQAEKDQKSLALIMAAS